MLILGLTGGIATGKSTVSKILSEAPYNLPIIDADVIARRVVAPGTSAYKQIVACFASTIPDLLLETPSSSLSPNKTPSFNEETMAKNTSGAALNRAALGRYVFGDGEECRKNRAVLNSIVHPAVRRELMKEILKNYIRGQRLVVLDVPLLFEGKIDLFCNMVVVVAVRDPKIQMNRLLNRDPHLSQTDAEARVQSQTDLSAKVRKCINRGQDYGVVIYNDGDIQELREEVQQVVSRIRNCYPLWWTRLLWFFPPLTLWIRIWHFGRNWLLNRRWEQQELKSKSEI